MHKAVRSLSETAPKPDRRKKDSFIRRLRQDDPQPRQTAFHLIKSQFAYIRKPIWFVSAAALLFAIWRIQADGEPAFSVCAIMPFISCSAIWETSRSGRHGMTEMESATFLSLRGLLFARFLCVGAAHILLLVLLSLLIGSRTEYGYGQIGAMLTVPYLLSSVISLETERSSLGRRNKYMCILISLLVSLLMLFLEHENAFINESLRWMWYLMSAALIIIEYREIKKIFHWEEYVWS